MQKLKLRLIFSLSFSFGCVFGDKYSNLFWIFYMKYRREVYIWGHKGCDSEEVRRKCGGIWRVPMGEKNRFSLPSESILEEKC